MVDIAISLNGVERKIHGETIADLIRELGLEGQKVAIERNREIVSRSCYEQTRLTTGDQIEVVQFVGGG